jgi:Rps23 Pro-64 3,4-dihydroxylase Tpa1-like proline 4-hydroxylase
MLQNIHDAELILSPVKHIVIDNFLSEKSAAALSEEFGSYESEHWHVYSNQIEEKRTCNQWNLFKNVTYQYFTAICSTSVVQAISEKFDMKLEADFGLHGGGQHIHAKMGNLNPHLDYALHPKLGFERRINVIYYLTDSYDKSDGGHFGLWGNSNSNEPGDLECEYAPVFNRMVLFDTSENSWHGLSRIYNPAGTKYRKSLASYYVSEPRSSAQTHSRAKFAPRENQKENSEIKELIELRSTEGAHTSAYIKK